MKLRSCLAMMCVCAFLAAVTLGQQTEDVVLENTALRLAIKRAPAPHVAQLLHRGSGVAVISNTADHDLFAIELSAPDGKTQTIRSSTSAKSEARITEDGRTQSTILTFSGFPEPGLRVQVTAAVDRDQPLTVWSIQYENKGRRPVTSVRFPMLKAVPQIGDAQDDTLVLPCLPGALIRNPAESWRLNGGTRLTYPGEMSAQFVAYQDRQAGLFFSSRDTQSHPRWMDIWKRKDGFSLSHYYRLNNSTAERWEAPYPVVIGVTQGTWCDSADLYKSWARRQSWCAKTLTQRADIPEWWKAGPLVYVCAVRVYDKKGIVAGSYYPKMLEHLRYLRKQVDSGPLVAMLASWENHRRWTGGDYFPIFDQEQAKRVIAQIKSDGFRPFFFLSGLYYTFANEGVNASTIPAAEKYREFYVIDQKTGEPQVFTLKGHSKTIPFLRKSYEICVGTPFVTTFSRDVIDKTHELGVDVLQMDQTVRGAGSACYSTKHDHPPGTGTYQAQRFHALLDDMRTYGKSKSNDFVLFHEEPHEELIPHLDGFHMRDYKEKFWYRNRPGAVGIPLFTYLYHEYAVGYGGDSATISPRENPWLPRIHAVNLITGKTPGVSVWSSPENLFKSCPQPLTVVRNHCRLLRTRARQYLMLGTMLHPYELDVPKATYRVWVGQGKKPVEFIEPSVLTSSWRAPDGGVGHVFINLAKTRQTLKVAVDTRNAPLAGTCHVEVYRSEVEGGFKPLWEAATLPRDFTAELAPLEVLFLDLQAVH